MGIRFYYSDGTEGSKETLNKLESIQKILELFETKKVESVEIIYKKETSTHKCTSLNN